MSKRLFFILFFFILLFSFLIRVIPILNGNFYFTADQGRDALYVREILHGKLVLKGPETSISGLYAGPLWYYFISFGYFIFGGNPVGAPFMMILLNVFITGFLMYKVWKHVGAIEALAVGSLLQFFWWFYDTSRWGFNPFPLVALSILLIMFLAEKRYFWGLLPIFFAFNANLAGATALFLFWFFVGAWEIKKGSLNIRKYFISVFIIIVFSFFLFGKKAGILFLNGQFLGRDGAGLGIFSGTDYLKVGKEFLKMVSNSTVPQNIVLGIIAFLTVLFLFSRKKEQNLFVRRFVLLSLFLFSVSFLFFGATHGWRDWQTVYLPVCLFVSLLLMIFGLPKKIRLLFLFFFIFLQILVFKTRYWQYFNVNSDFGILANQEKVIDWIYRESENDGFNVYSYTSSFYDYTWQYLFWWYGRRKYGFIPCEYANYPASLKYLYVPNPEKYSEPKLGCDRFRFLVIEHDPPSSGNFGEARQKEEWEARVSGIGKVVDKAVFSGIEVRKLEKIN